MKKIILITMAVFLNFLLFSCSADDISEEIQLETQAKDECCGEDEHILNPPPTNP